MFVGATQYDSFKNLDSLKKRMDELDELFSSTCKYTVKMPTNLANNKETSVYLTLENLDLFLESRRDYLLDHLELHDGLLFFFLGHGGSVKDRDFICTSDARIKQCAHCEKEHFFGYRYILDIQNDFCYPDTLANIPKLFFSFACRKTASSFNEDAHQDCKMEKKIIYSQKNIFTFFPTLPNETVSARNSRKIIKAFREKASESLIQRANFNLKELLIENQKKIKEQTTLKRSTPCIDGPLSKKMHKVFFYMLDNQTKEDWFTASKRGHIDVLKEIYKNYRKIDVSLKDGNGKTALEYARFYKKRNVINYLNNVYRPRRIKNKALDEITKKRFLYAINSRSIPLVKDILRAYFVDLNSIDCDGKRLWFYVIERGGYAVTKLLIRHCVDADINAKDKDGKTALHWYILHGKVRGARILLEAGAKKDIKDNEGQIPLDIAKRYINWDWKSGCDTRQEMIDLLEKKKSLDEQSKRIWWHAIEKSDTKEVKKILQEYFVDVNAPDKYGSTPLHKAVGWGSKELVALLLEAGAEKYIKDSEGQTPGGIARKRGEKEIIAFFQLPIR
ncbi:MAG: ankyrin repeat domain-containing protein [Bacteroidota bacterium]